MTNAEILTSRATRRHHLAAASRQYLGKTGLAAQALRHLRHQDRPMIVNRDIDGLTSALILSEVTGWKIGAVTWAKKIYVHPDFGSVADLLDATPFGVDVYSSRIPSLSNHMQLIGSDFLDVGPSLKRLIEDYDAEVVRRGERLDSFAFAPSIWTRSQAANGDDLDPRSRRYRYPMGSAQIILAILESMGEAPDIRDLQYTPTLIAHCDGGLKTAVTAGYNVLPWIDTLAAAAGPQSWTSHNRTAVLSNGPDIFNSLVRSLHAESPGVASNLNLDWNLAGAGKREVHRAVVEWLMQENGWEDPFMAGPSGASGLATYYTRRARQKWRTFDLAPGDIALDGDAVKKRGASAAGADLKEALASINTGAYQRDKVRLFWNAAP